MPAELDRLRANGDAWKRWGPYLSERAWGTVREDYSSDGDAWRYVPHDAARSHAYRWNEEGLAGICDDRQHLCFALSLWNTRDPILKERLFGLSGPEGNHGEDVKEDYFYLDSTPTHSYMRMLYRYPQRAYPYSMLVDENRRRTRDDPELELVDTGAYDDNRFFDVTVEYAKADTDDVLARITIVNHGPDTAPIVVLPTLWFRNTWSWREAARPSLRADEGRGIPIVTIDHQNLGPLVLWSKDAEALVFTENDTNVERLFGSPNPGPYVKDVFHAYVVHGRVDAVNPARAGTKAAAVYRLDLAPGASTSLRLRLARRDIEPFAGFDDIVDLRRRESDEFYDALLSDVHDDDLKGITRQAYAGLLWSKQYYHYDVKHWLDGDSQQPPPPPERQNGRNHKWLHLVNANVISMPDTWEYPWYAAWDLAFNCVALARCDPDFAKAQIELLTREWYQHPNGQLPGYEWSFDEVNPPVLAWAALRVFEIEHSQSGVADLTFLKRVFHKLLLDFTWWVNREDSQGNNIFEGGFLGLDNIGIFDRSKPLPTGGFIEQSDGTSWMGMYCLNMLSICLVLARDDHTYEDLAGKFFDHFLFIAGAMHNIGGRGIQLWDDEDGFFYDMLLLPNCTHVQLKVRSYVGLIPLLAVVTIDAQTLAALPRFAARLEWFLALRPELAGLISYWHVPGQGDLHQLALVRGHRLKCLLRYALDPDEFLSEFGVRSLSKHHLHDPFSLPVDGASYAGAYEPAESRSGTFGGNSNWRGPVWFPINYLLIEALRRFHGYYGDDFLVECPTGSGKNMTLLQIADMLADRLIALFRRDGQGNRPFHGSNALLQQDEHWRDMLLFHEYFHGDTGQGLGASHQTGWTALIANIIQSRAGGAWI